MKKPVISICYPTYNRAEIIYANVNHLLNNYDGDDIEVIVLDNDSPDDTKQKMQLIHDNRFKYYRNSENIGSQNLLAILRKASAQFALLVSDEDTIDCSVLPRIIDVLKRNKSIGIVYAAADAGGSVRFVKKGKYKGFKAIEAIEDHTYMSGFIYNVKAVCYELAGIDDANIFNIYGKGYNFLMLAILIGSKNGLICLEDVICKNSYDGKRDYSSYVYLKDNVNVVYEQRLDQAKKYIDVLRRIPLSPREICILINQVATHFIRMVTISYVEYMDNQVKIETEDGHELYWPPIERNFNPEKIARQFLKDYFGYIFNVGLASKMRMILCSCLDLRRNIRFVRTSILYVRKAKKIMPTIVANAPADI